MKVDVIQYEPFHAFDIIERNARDIDLRANAEIFKEAAHGWKEYGPAYTIVVDGEIVTCAGVVINQWHCGEAWTLLSGSFYLYPKTLYKIIKKYLGDIISDNKLVRVQAFVYSEQEKAGNFCRHLGFEKEGRLKKYGPNHEDMDIYARLI